MSLFHKIATFVFGIFESKQARYHRDCEEAFRQYQQEHNDADFPK